jgi:hypothetical protein
MFRKFKHFQVPSAAKRVRKAWESTSEVDSWQCSSISTNISLGTPNFRFFSTTRVYSLNILKLGIKDFKRKWVNEWEKKFFLSTSSFHCWRQTFLYIVTQQLIRRQATEWWEIIIISIILVFMSTKSIEDS